MKGSKVMLLIAILLVLAVAVFFGVKQMSRDVETINSGDEVTPSKSGDVTPEVLEENNYETVEKNPIVTLSVKDVGVIKIELFPAVAPNTVENFIELVQSGFYNGLTFHRTMPGFMAQGGDPSGDGTGGPGYGIKGEFSLNGVENNLSHERGIVSMARAQEFNSAGSQFFIVTTDSTYLDTQYAAFGKVLEGMDVVDIVVNQEVVRRKLDEGLDYYTNPEEYVKQSLELNRPINPPVIESATVETFGVTYDAPEKI